MKFKMSIIFLILHKTPVGFVTASENNMLNIFIKFYALELLTAGGREFSSRWVTSTPTKMRPKSETLKSKLNHFSLTEESLRSR